jgi:hypothetical protein
MTGDPNQRIAERYWLTEKGWRAARLAQQREDSAPPPTTCRITVWPPSNGGGNHLHETRPCGEPAVEGSLCAAHLAEKRRLS